MAFANVFRGRPVFVTGHTGFKGSWLCEWLVQLGADVHGYALDPQPEAVLYDQLHLADRLKSDSRGDLADAARLVEVIGEIRPDFVFHMAAQPIVRLSYQQPVSTYLTNVIGTINVLESLRKLKKSCAAVFVTTDKCYDNREWVHGYREVDPLGGHDPYSSSKAAAEIAISSWRNSFFSGHPVRIASARAGNVIGGGDWALDRILPDAIRSLQTGRVIPVRNKYATRPWQHVLEPLSGYLQLAASIDQAITQSSMAQLAVLQSSFNFGPGLTANRPVEAVVEEVLKHWPGGWQDFTDPNAVHEAKLLNLVTDKAFHLLKWQSVWNFEETIARTVSWYRRSSDGDVDHQSLTARQIEDYTAAAKAQNISWTFE